ncbi:phosphate acetyltransferase [Azotobacter beijerinckii]|uniref:phosphate acetyltransferase n=1 Tax=Azotobacter beijerinckii TaxID=170623 RepID=UPI002953DE96|nr:phosphate acetyltransferase [Azotobacter beijerinckii]MDV7210427.1 phosphate acetyltransferase [Azotobacter beijerinckii]
MQTFLIAPSGYGVGLTSVSLGLVRALERRGLKVGFFKPVAQPHPGDAGPERSSALIARTHHLTPPEPLPLALVERRLGDGQLDELQEDILGRLQQLENGHDVLIVEGLVPSPQVGYAVRFNGQLARSLNADVILVATPAEESLEELRDRLDIQARLFGAGQDSPVAGVILNKVRPGPLAERLCQPEPLGKALRLLGCVPWREALNTPRTSDIADLLGARLVNAGDYRQRRVRHTLLCAAGVLSLLAQFRPGSLLVTPGDRHDVILAAALASRNGMPLAGLLLCSALPADAQVLEQCRPAMADGLPVLAVDRAPEETLRELERLNREIPLDDLERAEQISDYVASHLDHAWLTRRCGTPREPRLSPPAFRYRLVKRAQAANRRIVLPEGSEPRTVQAAAICQRRGIARCVLLAKPEEVQAVAHAQGLEMPAGLEILDPEAIRERYVEPMVELRRHKGLSAPAARAQLEDNVVLGTLMLALDEVDGLVSGAVHTTANTIRPALQLIKTAPGCRLVSSVFFMLLPDQVLVYGDCAVNPDPDAAELADIALQSAASAQAFGIPPRVAMISYSTGDSGEGADVEKVREATRLARLARPDLAIDGPLQYDAAAIASVGRQKAPDSPVAGRATVFVFPDLNTGNTTYKAVQRSANCVSVGPMLQGLRKPVNDLSRGALVDDIVFTIALTAIQAGTAAG